MFILNKSKGLKSISKSLAQEAIKRRENKIQIK